MTPWLTVNLKPRKFSPRAVRIQGAALVVTGSIMLGLLAYGATTIGTPVDPAGTTLLHGIFAWLVLLGLMVCAVGVQQIVTSTRKRACVIVLGVMFLLTLVGAWTLSQTLT